MHATLTVQMEIFCIMLIKGKGIEVCALSAEGPTSSHSIFINNSEQGTIKNIIAIRYKNIAPSQYISSIKARL